MKLKSLPKELLAEVLDYIADYERLEGLDHILEGDYTTLDVRGVFREIAVHLRKQVTEEREDKSLVDVRKDENLSREVKNLLSVLSPGDERRLLMKFGLLDV